MKKRVFAALLVIGNLSLAAPKQQEKIPVMPKEVTLTSGRVLRNVQVVRWERDCVVLRYSGGVDPISFVLFKKPTPAEVAKIKAAQEEQVSVEREAALAKAQNALPEKIRDAVQRRAKMEFMTHRKMGAESELKYDLHIDLEEPRTVEGWPGRYEVLGVGWFQYYDSIRGNFSSDKSWFRAYVEVKNVRGTPRVIEFSRLPNEPLR
ncbi:MAG: hypothetical protein PHQ04_02275 [Opitutaceae bacterium]|nr:hypothetical protein [Opitutaceae bacterium]